MLPKKKKIVTFNVQIVYPWTVILNKTFSHDVFNLNHLKCSFFSNLLINKQIDFKDFNLGGNIKCEK